VSERVQIGRVGRPHGIDGSFFVEQPSDDERWWKPGARFFAGGQEAEVVASAALVGSPGRQARPGRRARRPDRGRARCPPADGS